MMMGTAVLLDVTLCRYADTNNLKKYAAFIFTVAWEDSCVTDEMFPTV
jgi:hypothetical protein